MKQLFTAFLILSYLAGGLGLNTHQHFCCGELVSVNIVSKISADLILETEQPETEQEGCCNQKIVKIKIDDGISLVKLVLPENGFFGFAVLEKTFSPVIPISGFLTSLLPVNKAPPDFGLRPIYLLIHCLII